MQMNFYNLKYTTTAIENNNNNEKKARTRTEKDFLSLLPALSLYIWLGENLFTRDDNRTLFAMVVNTVHLYANIVPMCTQRFLLGEF